MYEKPRLAIRAAVMNCLARCTESETPLVCLSEFLEKLAELGWQKEDVEAVRNMVLKLMLTISRQRQGDAGDSILAAN